MTGPVNQIDDMPNKAKVKQLERQTCKGCTSGLYCVQQSMIQLIKDANNAELDVYIRVRFWTSMKRTHPTMIAIADGLGKSIKR